ncbi:MAG: M28 family peptidase [Spirochaetales bacterium]|nr:M28 family peptidase [Spirochaetales bacterium]
MKSALKSQKLFSKFCELNSNRYEIIISIIEHEGLPYSIIEFEGAKHIVLFPENLVSRKDCSVFLAHYDRVPKTPGANDNSASVFYLLYHGRKLKDKNHNTIIIFTDKEEIGEESSVKKQGAFTLANYFRTKNIKNLHFFVFDMCGIGSTIILGTAGENLLKKHYKEKYKFNPLKNDVDKVKRDAENSLLSVNNGEYFYLTPLFSDDLGLILNGYPAVLISLLPYNEVIDYKKNPHQLPKSWACNHTEDDTVDTLDPESWIALEPLLNKLSNIKDDVVEELKEIDSFYCTKQEFTELESPFYVPEPINFLIEKEAFELQKIKTDKMPLMEEIHMLCSTVKPNALGYVLKKSKRKSTDPTQSIFHYVKDLIETELPRLPRAFRETIYKHYKNDNHTILVEYIYDSFISQIDQYFFINSRLYDYKSKVIVKIEEKDYTYHIKIISDDLIIGTIHMVNNEYGKILDSGHFIPNEILKFDPVSMLKGLRSLLIKWSKLHNNNSLRINLKRSAWIGCDQIFRLCHMEFNGRLSYPEDSTLKYMWKR